MHIHLNELTYLSELDLFKIIISSADFFPGLYRMTSSWQKDIEQGRYLNLLQFLEILHQSETGKKWPRRQWFDAQEHLFNIGFGPNSRNEERAEVNLRDLLKSKQKLWYSTPQSFSLALIDGSASVHEINVDRTYYVMGSLIRFEKDKVLISYDDMTEIAGLTLNVSFVVAKQYIESVTSKTSLAKLFLPAEIIAHLNFADDVGSLSYNKQRWPYWLVDYPANCTVFAAPNYNEILPIRFAKPIGVSNVLA